MFLLPCASSHFIFTSMIVLICSYFSWVLITHIFISSLSHSLLSSYCALWLPLIEVIGLSFKNLCHNVCVEFSYILWLCCFDACSSGKFWCSPVFNLKFKRLLIETVPYKNISAHHKVTWITLPWLFVGQSSGCVCKGCWGDRQLLYLTVVVLPASLFPQTFCFLLKWPFSIALPSLFLWTKLCPGGRLLPALLPLCPLPLLHQRGVSFALLGEPVTCREHTVSKLPGMCCPGLFALVTHRILPFLSSPQQGLCVISTVSAPDFMLLVLGTRCRLSLTSGWVHTHSVFAGIFCDLFS